MSCLDSWDPSEAATNAAEKICLWLPSLLIIYDTFYLTLQSEMIIAIVCIKQVVIFQNPNNDKRMYYAILYFQNLIRKLSIKITAQYSSI